MPITLNSTTLADCEATAQLVAATPAPTGGGTRSQGDNTTFSQRYGTQCVEFAYTAAVTNGGIKLATALAGAARIDLTQNEVSIWFLNGKFDGDGNELISTADVGIRLRVYSGTNWADYNQVQHKNKIDGTWNGGWLYLRASGDAGTEDANSGTWGNAQATTVDNIAVIVNSLQANDGTSDPDFAVDWFKYYNGIDITGFANPPTNTIAWTPTDIETELNVTPGAGPVGLAGVVTQTENFFRFFCGINFGESPAATGRFEADNEFLFLAHSSSDFKYNISVLDDFTVQLGVKNDTGTFTYAQDGVQLVSTENGFFAETLPVKCAPSLTVQSGALFDAYATLIQGFGTINFGSGNTAQVDDIELIGADLYDNDEVEFRSTQIEVDNIRIHQDSADKGTLGTVYSVPTQFDRVNTFNGTDGLTYRVTMTADRFSAGDLTFDVVVLDGQELTLLDSVFDIGAIKRIT